MTIYHNHHIIPKHMGGTDDPTNLIKLTVEEHAEAHKILFEEYGRWQDKLAWQGLSGLIGRDEINRIRASTSGKIGNEIRLSRGGNTGMKYKYAPRPNQVGAKNPCARQYQITYPNGEIEIITSLKTWCQDNDLKYNSLHKTCITRGQTHKGHRVKPL